MSRSLRSLGLAFILMTLAACQSTAQPASPSSAPGKAAPGGTGQSLPAQPPKGAEAPPPRAIPMTIANAVLITRVIPLWLAKDLGFFQEAGLEAQIQEARSGPVAMAALASGEVQVFLSGTEFITARAAGADVFMFGGYQDNTLSTLTVRRGINIPQDMRGKLLGVFSIGGTNHVRALLTLKRMGLDPERDNIQIQAIGDQPTMAQALAAGSIDAAPIDYVYAEKLKAEGFQVLDLAEMKVPSADLAFATTREYAGKNGEALQRFLKAMARAVAYLKASPQDRAKREKVLEVATDHLKTTPDAVQLDVDKLAQYARQDLRPSREVMREIKEFLGEINPKVKDLTLDELIDYSLLDKLEREGFFRSLAQGGGAAPR